MTAVDRTARINVRIDPALKKAGDTILTELGYTPSSAIALLYQALVVNRAIPVEMTKLDPLDVATAKAHEEITRGDSATFSNLADLLKDLHANN